MQSSPKIESIKIAVYTFPTATPKSDGTFEWKKTGFVAKFYRQASFGNRGSVMTEC
jgi:hypothetical protein